MDGADTRRCPHVDLTCDQWRQLVESRYAPGKKPPNWVIASQPLRRLIVVLPPTPDEAATIEEMKRTPYAPNALSQWAEGCRETILGRAGLAGVAASGSVAITLDNDGLETVRYLELFRRSA